MIVPFPKSLLYQTPLFTPPRSHTTLPVYQSLRVRVAVLAFLTPGLPMLGCIIALA